MSGDKTIFKPFHIEVVDFLKSQLVTGHVSLLSVALYNIFSTLLSQSQNWKDQWMRFGDLVSRCFSINKCWEPENEGELTNRIKKVLVKQSIFGPHYPISEKWLEVYVSLTNKRLYAFIHIFTQLNGQVDNSSDQKQTKPLHCHCINVL